MTPPIQQMLYAQVPKDAVVTFLDVSNRSGNRGVWGGGYYSGSARDIIDYANIGASTADASDFGDLMEQILAISLTLQPTLVAVVMVLVVYLVVDIRGEIRMKFTI